MIRQVILFNFLNGFPLTHTVFVLISAHVLISAQPLFGKRTVRQLERIWYILFQAMKWECSVCLDEYKDPRLLSCYHTYCTDCLEDLLKAGCERPSCIRCPECKEYTKVSDNINSV